MREGDERVEGESMREWKERGRERRREGGRGEGEERGR